MTPPEPAVPAHTTTRTLTTPDGITLSLTERGDPTRPTVLLLHGYPDTKDIWHPVATALADRHGLHTIAYDTRGCGRSTAPSPLPGGFTLHRLTDDFLAVADALSPDTPLHLVGHDWGSVQGWEFATSPRTRGRVATFTSLSGPCLDHIGHWIHKRLTRPHPRHLAQFLTQSAKSWYIYALLTPGLLEALSRTSLPRTHPTLLHGAWLYRDNVRPRLAHPRPNPTAHAPVQLITPTRDPFVSPTLFEDLPHWTPTLTHRRLPTGHWLPRTHPLRLAAWIAEFVTAHDAPR